MKNNGQKFHTVKLLQSFINLNLEYLFSIRPADVDYGTPSYCANFDKRPIDQLTGREKNLLLKDKLRYEQWLLDICEEKVMARRAHMRDACVRTIYEECAP